VLLADPNLAALPDDLRQTAAEILLDGELGEERRMISIHTVEVVGHFEDDMQLKNGSIETVAAHVEYLVR
jgi:hypothetical protein